MLFGQFYEKWVSVRKRNIKLLLETVTCIIAIETVMYIMQCKNYYLHNCNRDSHLHNYNTKLSPTYSLQKLSPA